MLTKTEKALVEHRLPIHAAGLQEHERYPAGDPSGLTNADCVSYAGLLREALSLIERQSKMIDALRQPVTATGGSVTVVGEQTGFCNDVARLNPDNQGEEENDAR